MGPEQDTLENMKSRRLAAQAALDQATDDDKSAAAQPGPDANASAGEVVFGPDLSDADFAAKLKMIGSGPHVSQTQKAGAAPVDFEDV
eukprot:gene7838-7268_t